MSLYKETLMKHFRNPEYKYENSNSSIKKDGINPSCGDNITIFLDLKDGVINNLSFTGNGCAISMASADILCEVMTGIKEPKKIIDDFLLMITGEEEIHFQGALKVLEVFKEMQQYPARRSCATLPWETLKITLDS